MFAPADARCHLVNQRELTLSFEADSLPRGNAVYRFPELLQTDSLYSDIRNYLRRILHSIEY